MEWIGYIAAIAIGISLGLIGGGGSILTVPVLVYLLHIEPVLATTYSLFVVGTSSLVGGTQAFRRQLVDWPAVFLFGLPSIISVFLTRYFLLPVIPKELFSIGNLLVTRDVFLMLVFALLMLLSSVSMIRSGRNGEEAAGGERRTLLLVLQGLLVGAVTGILGAGGGFLIIPALVLFSRLPMKTAVGSSLVIIAINSLFGFFSTLFHYTINWSQLLLFTGIAVAGILVGFKLSDRFSPGVLKRGFGWFVLAMSIYIFLKELFF